VTIQVKYIDINQEWDQKSPDIDLEAKAY